MSRPCEQIYKVAVNDMTNYSDAVVSSTISSLDLPDSADDEDIKALPSTKNNLSTSSLLLEISRRVKRQYDIIHDSVTS